MFQKLEYILKCTLHSFNPFSGTTFYANKVVLGARCEVMSAMFGGSFVESLSTVSEVKLQDVTSECFSALLEYLYTDHAPIEDGDSVGIMVLADEYCQKRLINLCELYITKEVDRSVTKQIEKSEIDVIGLLLTSQVRYQDLTNSLQAIPFY
jgi:Rho family protein